MLRGHYGTLQETEPGLAACKAKALPTVLWFQACLLFWREPHQSLLRPDSPPALAQRTLWDAEVQTQVSHIQGQCPLCCALTSAWEEHLDKPDVDFAGLFWALVSGMTPQGA